MAYSLPRRPGGLGLVVLALVLALADRAGAELITAADARGIRQFAGGSPFLLDFLAIQDDPFAADRTVIQFDLEAFTGPVASAFLRLDLFNLDPGGPAGVIDLFAFRGTGTVTADQFSAGALTTSFTNNASGVERVDVTAAVQAAQEAGHQYLGLRLSTTTTERWFVGPSFGREGPVLEAAVVPEPATLVLWGTGTLGLLGYGWCRRRRAGPSTPSAPGHERQRKTMNPGAPGASAL